MATALVSVIMPARNAERTVADAIASVLTQEHAAIQLFVVNDGSTDGTARILDATSDPRLTIIHQPQGGVSKARNAALEQASGSYVCFLDADDVMPEGSITSRLAVFEQDPELAFVDGAVLYCDALMRPTGKRYTPAFSGDPFPLLLAFDRRCFFGNTWMIRREVIGAIRFREDLTHVEDLMFYLEIAHGGRYGCTQLPVLHYRVTGQSSMVALDRLDRCYHVVLDWMLQHPERVSRSAYLNARRIVRRMMCGAYWHAKQPWKALRALVR